MHSDADKKARYRDAPNSALFYILNKTASTLINKAIMPGKTTATPAAKANAATQSKGLSPVMIHCAVHVCLCAARFH